MLAVPHNIGALSNTWLETALGSSARSLLAFDAEPIGTESGIIGQILRIRLDWGNTATPMPGSVIVKLTKDSPEDLARPDYREFFEREIRFYRDIAGGCGVRTPIIYWFGIDAVSGAAVLVMEDLSHGTIYESGAAPIEKVEAIVRAITPLHARWWNDQRLFEMNWLFPADFPGPAMLREAIPRVRPWYEKYAPDLIPLMERIPDALEHGLLHPRGSCTLIHGDLGLKNAAFLDDEVVLFDWQLLQHHTPGQELVEIVKDGFGQVGPKELAARVIAVYHEAMRAHGVVDLSLDELTDCFGQAATRGIMSPLTLLGVANGGPTYEAVALRWTTVALSLLEEYELERRLEDALK